MILFFPRQVVGRICQATRFFGSVDIDMVRPIKALETIIDAVVVQLQHSPGTMVKLTLDIEAISAAGFSESNIGVLRDNAGQLKFNPESTGFEESETTG